MKIIKYVLIFISILLPLIQTYTLLVNVQNPVINAQTNYIYSFGFSDSLQKSVVLQFSTNSDLSSPLLAIYVNNNAAALANTSYSIDNNAKRISINNQVPSGVSLIFKITNIFNPPSAQQFTFTATVTPSEAISGSIPYINYQRGNLQSCNWKFDKYTGSTNSVADIDIVLGNKLNSGLNGIVIQYPNLFQDSDYKSLTLNANPTITYCTDGTNYLSPLSSPATTISGIRMTFWINLATPLAASATIKIRLTGVGNPPTQKPSGKNFNVSTVDSANRGIDKISQCTITPLNVLQVYGTFDMTTLKVNTNYPNAKIIVPTLIPFTVFQYDTLQLDHNQALKITNSTQLQMTFTRGSTFSSFYYDNSQAATTTTKYFQGNLDNSNQGFTTQISFNFNISSPFSQKPWDFVLWFKRNSGAYVKVIATLQAYSIAIDPLKVSLLPASTEMATNSQYTLTLQLQKPISKSGKILLGFHSDYDIKSGSCIGFNGLAQITSSPACDLLNKNGYKYLVYRIGQTSTAIIDAGTQIKIQYSSSSIKNPLYPNTYNYRLQVYYTESDDSLVQKAEIFGSITMTTHTSLKALLVPNDFTVYELATLTISYTNDVYIPMNSVLQFVLPGGVTSFEFTDKIIIDSSDIKNATLSKLTTGGKIGQITIKQDIGPGTLWEIPLSVKMPVICGQYPTITFKISKSSIIYQRVDSGLGIRVKYPSIQLTSIIQPRTNTTIDASTDYLVRIQSRVPLATPFYVTLTLPTTQVKLVAASSCISNKGTCTSITSPSPNMVKFTLINSPYTLSDQSQDFDFYVSTFTNPRNQGVTSNWQIQLQGLYNNVVSEISKTTAVSTNFVHSQNTYCQFDQTKNYYTSNTEPVIIKCAFVNNLVVGDFIQFTITSDAYKLNAGVGFMCTSPVLSSITCTNTYSSSTTLTIKVVIVTNFTSNRNQLSLQITGLISNAYTTYDTPSIPVYVKRFDTNSKAIDQGIFSYDISCNQNPTIKSKLCKTCLNGLCQSCYSSMYLATTGICVKDCPVDTQYRALNNLASSKCQPCTSPCFKCQNTSTTCLSCISSPTITYYLYRSSHTCQTICDTSLSLWINTLSIPGQNICDSCLAECKRCYNNSLTGCYECNTGFVLENGACRTSCLDTRSYIRNGVCVSCNSACETCNGSGANNCVQCKQLYYMNNGYCVATCPSNKYPLSNGNCGCESNCATCTSTSPTFCVSCLNSSQLIFNGTCLSSCPSYSYMSSTQCLSCPKNCITCTNGLSCINCGPGYYIYESTCYGDCNSIGLQYDSSGNNCVLCPTGCDRCLDDTCTACLDGFVKNGSECIKQCLLTNTCNTKSVVPDIITPVPATLTFIVWIGIVLVAKWFNPKIYSPYSIVFFTSAIEYILILGTTIYSSDLISSSVKRLLQVDITQRPVMMYLLIIGLVVNYLMNIVFAIIFYKYMVPIIESPRQIDYITIGVVFVLGILTNYRFCLIYFSKMFPKPKIDTKLQSQLTPIHYLCITSLFLSGFSLGAAGIILKNEYPLTDIFMLGIDILIIQVILIVCSIWMVAVKKGEQYFQTQIKKHYLEQNYNTKQDLNQNDDKNITKNHLNFKDQFNDKTFQNGNYLDDTNQKQLIDRKTGINIGQISDYDKPLQKRQNRLQTQKIRISSNKIQNSFDTDISQLSKLKLNKRKSNQINQSNLGLKSKLKQNVIDYDKQNHIIFDNKKFQTSDQDNMPKTIEHQQTNNNILADIHQPSSDDIPNLPNSNSVFYDRANSELGRKFKPKKVLNNPNTPKSSQPRSQIIKNKSMSPNKLRQMGLSQTQSKSNMMKKKNKFFQSEIQPQKDNNQIQQIDIQSIIRNRIVIIENKDNKDITMSDPNNISSIQKKQEQNSQFNEQVSPSWFNIQNQRFDISSVHSDFSDQ